MSNIHTSGYFFEVENFSNWNNGVSRFYYYQTVNTNEHIYSFSYNSATITPNSDYETIVYKTNQSGWYDYDGSSNPWSLTTVNGVTSGTNSSGSVMMKWGHTGYPDPTIVSSGPTVTSITVASTVSATRQFTVTHTGTLTVNDISYKINGVDITTLTSPNTPITNLQTTSTGSTFDSYTMSSAGYHIINIGSQYLVFYKSVSLKQTSFPELTNAGLSISFPSTSALWLAKATGYDSVTLYNDGAQYKGTSQFNGYDRIEYLWIGTKYFTNTDPTLRGFKAYVNTYIDEPPARWLQGSVSYIDPVARYESTGLLTSSFYAGQNHVSNGGYYTFDFVSLIEQATNGGGKRRRYPYLTLVMN